jgi:excinuclease UvrABC ATPase subunit
VPFDQKTPWRDLPKAVRDLLLHGDPKRKFLLPPPKGRKPVETVWTGMFTELEHAYRTTTGESLRQRLLQFQAGSVCAGCHGRRLSPTALSLRLNGKTMAEFLAMTIPAALEFTRQLATHPGVMPAEEARRGLEQRLAFLHEAGLNYLTLDRERQFALRRRSPTRAPRHAARPRARRRDLRPRRTQHRPAPERPSSPDRLDPRPARPRQHRPRRRT